MKNRERIDRRTENEPTEKSPFTDEMLENMRRFTVAEYFNMLPDNDNYAAASQMNLRDYCDNDYDMTKYNAPANLAPNKINKNETSHNAEREKKKSTLGEKMAKIVVSLLIVGGVTTVAGGTVAHYNPTWAGQEIQQIESAVHNVFHPAQKMSKEDQATRDKQATANANRKKEKAPEEDTSWQQYLIPLNVPDQTKVGTIDIGTTGTHHELNKVSSYTSLEGVNDNTANITGDAIGGSGIKVWAHDYQDANITDGFTQLGTPANIGNSYLNASKGLINSPRIGQVDTYTSTDAAGNKTTVSYTVKNVVYADAKTGNIIDSNGNAINNANVTASNPWNAGNYKLDANGNPIAGTQGQGNSQNLRTAIESTCVQMNGNTLLPNNAQYKTVDQYQEAKNFRVVYITTLNSISYNNTTYTFGTANSNAGAPGSGTTQLVNKTTSNNK